MLGKTNQALVKVTELIHKLSFVQPVVDKGRRGALLVGDQLQKLEKKYQGTIVVRRMSNARIEGNLATQFVKAH